METGSWVPSAPLLKHLSVSRLQVKRVVAQSGKQRFSLRGERIRADQRHRVPVELELLPAEPSRPASCITARSRHVGHRARQYSAQRFAACAAPPPSPLAGRGDGPAVMLTVRSGLLAAAEHLFHRSDNGVWLVGEVPGQFLIFS